jgi:hypothetical protein
MAEMQRWVAEEVTKQLPAVVDAVAEKFAAMLSALPVVNVNRRPVEKTFTYDGMGRPATVVERELPETRTGDSDET